MATGSRLSPDAIVDSAGDASSKEGDAVADSLDGTGSAVIVDAMGELVSPSPPFSCIVGGLTACVHSCGEADNFERMAAQCVDGHYECPSPLIVAASCPAVWPDPNLPCGPWIANYDCGAGSAVCSMKVWTCPPPDGSAR
jgi:hypothetical protein